MKVESNMKFPDHPFWDFALGVYRREGVGAACLELQEHHGMDVNIMLFCLWLADTGRGVLDGVEMAGVVEASDSWHRDVVKGLRAVRRILKDGFPDAPQDLRESLRAEVQATEIDSEHLEQLMLAGAISREAGLRELSPEQRAADAAANFRLYLSTFDVVLNARDCVAYAHILGQAYPGLGPEPALDIAETLMLAIKS